MYGCFGSVLVPRHPCLYPVIFYSKIVIGLYCMKIALIGYGKMGKEIESIALGRGHEITLVIDVDNQHDLNEQNLQAVDVAIEFSTPQTAVEHYKKCFSQGIPVVSGTTGWLDRFSEIETLCQEEGKAFFYASNFSLGVNLFFQLNAYLARMMNKHNEYEVKMTETHHTQKLDAPSGTAITLAEEVLAAMDRKTEWQLDVPSSDQILGIQSVRRDPVPGIHTLSYESDVDVIEITHDAKSRRGFALGAVLAAEYMQDKRTGVYGMKDLMES